MRVQYVPDSAGIYSPQGNHTKCGFSFFFSNGIALMPLFDAFLSQTLGVWFIHYFPFLKSSVCVYADKQHTPLGSVTWLKASGLGPFGGLAADQR